MKALLLKLIRFYRSNLSPARAALLPFYSHLFGLCLGGGGKVRRVEGRMAGTQAYPEMSALP